MIDTSMFVFYTSLLAKKKCQGCNICGLRVFGDRFDIFLWNFEDCGHGGWWTHVNLKRHFTWCQSFGPCVAVRPFVKPWKG